MATATKRKNENLLYAVAYVRQGWLVVPLHWIQKGRCSCKAGRKCNSPGKHPLIQWSDQEEVTEKQAIRWWHRWPRANVGILTGRHSGIIVLDVDGKEGQATLDRKGCKPGYTVCVKTGGGGWHYYYSHPGGDCRNFAGQAGETILPNVDFRGDGGLVVAPPSSHISGNQYTWAVSPRDQGLEDPPSWLVALIRDQGSGRKSPAPPGHWRKITSGNIEDGRRNTTITRLAGHLLRRYVDPVVVLNLMLSFNKTHCSPPLQEKEVVKVVNSVSKAELRRRQENGKRFG